MLGSVGRSSLRVSTAVLVLFLAGCNGNGAPVGTPTTPTSSFQSTSTSNTSSNGVPVAFGGLQASDAVLNAVLQKMNDARAQVNLGPLSRDSLLDSCANSLAVTVSQGGAPGDTCGAKQFSGMTVTAGGDQMTSALSVVNAMISEGTPPTGTINDYSNITDPTFATVGIAVVTNNGKTYVIILFK